MLICTASHAVAFAFGRKRVNHSRALLGHDALLLIIIIIIILVIIIIIIITIITIITIKESLPRALSRYSANARASKVPPDAERLRMGPDTAWSLILRARFNVLTWVWGQ